MCASGYAKHGCVVVGNLHGERSGSVAGWLFCNADTLHSTKPFADIGCNGERCTMAEFSRYRERYNPGCIFSPLIATDIITEVFSRHTGNGRTAFQFCHDIARVPNPEHAFCRVKIACLNTHCICGAVNTQ